MNLICLGSSSSGNCYLLENETECLILECGIKFSEVKKALDFNVSKIVGVFASHVHGDHYGHAEEYLKSGIPVYAPEETHKSLSKEYDCQKIIRPGYWYQLGGFNVTPFLCEHDVECFGYIIKHTDMGILLFATDSSFIKNNFLKLKINHILVEANYSEAIINDLMSKGLIDQARVNRTFKTHMSIETCKEFVRANKTTSLDSVTLLHLSNGTSNAEQFKQEIQSIVGDAVKVAIADKNVTVNLNLFPW